jgi:hypothetical protein
MQQTLDDLMVKLAEQQRQLLAANAALESLIMQLAAVQLGGGDVPPVITSGLLGLTNLLIGPLVAALHAL